MRSEQVEMQCPCQETGDQLQSGGRSGLLYFDAEKFFKALHQHRLWNGF